MLGNCIEKLEAVSFRKKYFEEYKNLEVPFWERIKEKGSFISEYREFNNIKLDNVNQNGVYFDFIDNNIENLNHNFNENRYAIDRFYQTEVYAFHNAGYYIKVEEDAKIEKDIYIEFNLDKSNNQLLDLIVIEMGKNSCANIIIKYRGLDESNVYKNSILKVVANEYSNLNLSRIQNLNTESLNYDFSDFNLEENAIVKYASVEFGAKVNVVSSTAYLNGYKAEIETLPAYLADKERKVDLAYSVIYRGKKTTGMINGNGAVLDNATKVFRGNIYFEKGSSGSFGREGSFDILLSDKMTAHSIPTLFCDEDDVIGEHYSSIGKIDEARLLYLMSRGISEKSAKKLVVESSFRPIIENIAHEETKNELLEELGRRI